MGDSLDTVNRFLKQRDGIDKVLKVIRYTAKLLHGGRAVDTPLQLKLVALDASLGTTRKALRLGKFLANVDACRDLLAHKEVSPLALIASAGEGTYYFLDQFIWLVKAGVLPRGLAPRLNKWSASAELAGYVASVTLKVLALRMLKQRVGQFEDTMSRVSMSSIPPVSGAAEDDDVLRQAQQQLAGCRTRERLLTVLLVQDIADALIALQEIVGKTVTVAKPHTVALCGLVSASASIWKNWPC